MKKGFAYISFLVLLSACQMASFTARPGVIIKTFPETIYGKYQFIEKHKGYKDTHVVSIGVNGVISNDPLVSGILAQNDSNNTLSHLGDFYYINVHHTDSLGKHAWFVYPFEFDHNNLYVYKLVLTKKSVKRMKRAGLELTGKESGEYTMDNQAFKAYCEKFMKRRDAIKFKRIQ